MTVAEIHKALSINNLDISLRAGPKILNGVNLDIAYGRILGVIGESGAGKSMIGTAIADTLPRALQITNGSIEFEGLELTAMTPKVRRALLGRDIGFIPQEPMTALNPSLTIGQQMGDHLARIGYGSKRDRIDKAVALFEEVGLNRAKALLESYPHQLSGGMLQRVLIAMAFASNPKLVVADEPTTALDVTIQAQIIQQLRELKKQLEMSIILITHNFGIIGDIADRVAVMFRGKIVEEGETRQVLHSPQHPYTQALIQCIPQLGQRRKRLTTIDHAALESAV